MDLITLISQEYNIPIIENHKKVWFFRTKAGEFYDDFLTNGFVGIGWNEIGVELITDERLSYAEKKHRIEKIYPMEKRPGLIFSQMDIFFNKMKDGDYIVIPSLKGKQVAIGLIGQHVNDIRHIEIQEEYSKCDYEHKRLVKWLKIVNSWQDVYLFKALRAQQTISDITEVGRLVFRNLFPTYISRESIHISLHKATESELNIVDNITLQAGLIEIIDEVTELYGMQSFREEISIKTAVGSPGFIGMILPMIPVAGLATALITYLFIGKNRGADGSSVTGILGILHGINDLLDARENRKLIRANVKHIEAQTEGKKAETEKTKAETERIRAETEKIKAETKKMDSHNDVSIDGSEIQALNQKGNFFDNYENMKNEQVRIMPSGKTNVQEMEEQEKLDIPSNTVIEAAAKRLDKSAKLIYKAASKSGMTYGEEQIRDIG